MLAVPEPFVAYLRVYEPLSSFESPHRERLAEAIREPVDLFDVGTTEQVLWLRTQVGAPASLLPGTTADGRADDTAHAMVLDPEEVPTGPGATVGSDLLVCPLDLRGRAAAALVGFIGAAEPPLRAAALTVPVDKARVQAGAVVHELANNAVHVLSSTWTVPLPWFSVVDPAQRQVIERAEGTRPKVLWRTAMADARRRVARAHSIVRSSLGDEGPTKVLRETGRWLERFHPHSAVELDYGGLVGLMTDADLEDDTSAADVHEIIDALESGEIEDVSDRYQSLRDFWSAFAARERDN